MDPAVRKLLKYVHQVDVFLFYYVLEIYALVDRDAI
jgi:hypothetical protein